MNERTFIVVRDGEHHWRIVTGFLKTPIGALTMSAAKQAGSASGLSRTEANSLAERLNKWIDQQNGNGGTRRDRRAA